MGEKANQNQKGQGQQQNQQGQPDQGQQQNQQVTQTWDDILKTLPEEQQKLYTDYTSGLHNSVKATRDERDDLKNQVEEALKKAEKGSELEKSLTETLSKLDKAERRANFAEQAIQPEIGCRNVRAAFATAQADDLFRKNGDPDWDAIKKAAPELFGPVIPDGDAGKGTEKDAHQTADMNVAIRRMAGRK